jgi:hypothetical protein
MDCREVLDLVDAYALGAASADESAAIERHVADCVRCWEELSKAQRTAAMLALSVPILQTPPAAGERILSEARRDLSGIRSERKAPLLQRLRLGWSTTAYGLGAASIAALAFAGVLQAQVNDLQGQNDELEAQVAAANEEIAARSAEIEDVFATQATLISLVGPTTDIEMVPIAQGPKQVTVWYSWGDDERKGVVDCHDIPAPPQGKVYQVWFSANNARYAAESFTPEDGECFVPVELPEAWREPTGIGISIEDPDAVSDHPAGGWLVYAHFPDAP